MKNFELQTVFCCVCSIFIYTIFFSLENIFRNFFSVDPLQQNMHFFLFFCALTFKSILLLYFLELLLLLLFYLCETKSNLCRSYSSRSNLMKSSSSRLNSSGSNSSGSNSRRLNSSRLNLSRSNSNRLNLSRLMSRIKERQIEES